MANNSKEHPEAWAFYIENARNISKESDLKGLGKYRIPDPIGEDFIYANDVTELWAKFIQRWYEPNLNSPSIYGTIQYIVNKF